MSKFREAINREYSDQIFVGIKLDGTAGMNQEQMIEEIERLLRNVFKEGKRRHIDDHYEIKK